MANKVNFGEIINRLSNFGFKLKTWSFAIFTGYLLLNREAVLYIDIFVLVILFMLWALDSYYLTLERNIRKKTKDVGVRKLDKNERTIYNMFAWSTCLIHVPILLMMVTRIILKYFV